MNIQNRHEPVTLLQIMQIGTWPQRAFHRGTPARCILGLCFRKFVAKRGNIKELIQMIIDIQRTRNQKTFLKYN